MNLSFINNQSFAENDVKQFLLIYNGENIFHMNLEEEDEVGNTTKLLSGFISAIESFSTNFDNSSREIHTVSFGKSDIIINQDKSEILEALLKYQNSNTDVVDCILAAISSPEKVIISFDKDFDKLNAFSETI